MDINAELKIIKALLSSASKKNLVEEIAGPIGKVGVLLTEQKSKLIDKLIRRVEKTDEFRQTKQEFVETMLDLLAHSKAFQKSFNDLPEGENCMEDMMPAFMVQGLKEKRNQKRLRNFLVPYYKMIQYYHSDLLIEKKEGQIKSVRIVGTRFPDIAMFKIKGERVEPVWFPSRAKEFLEELTRFECLFEEIGIDDQTEYRKGEDNIVTQTIGETSMLFPTTIKYVHRDGNRRLFLCIPPGFDITTLSKEYRRALKKICENFYKVKYTGRETTMPHRIQEVRDIVESIKEEWKRKPSISKLCQLVAEKTGLQSSYIRRHFKPILKEERGRQKV